MSDTDLLGLTAELVAVGSVSRHEAALADLVQRRLAGCRWLEVDRVGDNVVARTTRGSGRRVLVAGHLDTVPAAGNAEPRSDGDVLWGLGAADMKGGLAVMLDLARTPPPGTGGAGGGGVGAGVDVTYCFYTCEEVARRESGLGVLWERRPELLEADVAVLGEPTDCRVEAGCQGTMRLSIELGGVRAHTARPFAGRNAVHRLAPVLTRVAEWEGRSVVLDGCEYAEQLQAVSVTGGVAANVVPDLAALTLNYRYAPDRGAIEARTVIEGLMDGLVDPALGDRLTVLDEADGALPSLGDPVLAALVRLTGAPPRAKAGWTDVATFWSHGIPAANFGPGDPLLAHHPDERVERSSLDRARQVLGSLLAGEG